MDSETKKNCKYGEKCYQRNELHFKKYNHPDVPPPKKINVSLPPAVQAAELEKEKEINKNADTSKKRKASEDNDDSTHLAKKNNPRRLLTHTDEVYAELLKSNDFFLEQFLVKMPKDFYLFWDFYTKLNEDKKESERHIFFNFNLELVGPFDFLAGKFATLEQKCAGEYLRHWRFYYDPPEFQTIFVKRGTGIHYGYWRDDPKHYENLLIARNDARQNGKFQFVATNSFDALAYFLEKDFKATPFNHSELSKLRRAIDEFVTEHKFIRNSLQLAMAKRSNSIVARTFHGAGIVAPIDKKLSLGYRPLAESNTNLRKLLGLLDKKSKEDQLVYVMEKLSPVISSSIIALDECDFGTNLELGMDLFTSGHEQLHNSVKLLLMPAYTLLQRPNFIAILKAHLDCRSRSIELSMLN